MRTHRLILAALLVAAVPSVAAAGEPTKVAGYKLGQKVKHSKPKRTKIFGCKGTLELQQNDAGITALEIDLDPGNCTNEDSSYLDREHIDAISRAMGVPPEIGSAGYLWQGKKVTVIATRDLDKGAMIFAQIRVVPATVGVKSNCFDDGFSDFYTQFQAAVAGGKSKQTVGFFQLPVVNDDMDYGNVKDAAGIAKLLNDDEKKTIASAIENDTLQCNLDLGDYSIPLHGVDMDYAYLTAEKTASGWKWTEILAHPPIGDE
jgi:hypothetical protein